MENRATATQETVTAPVGLYWGIKSSFLNYIAQLKDGRNYASEGAVLLEQGTYFEFDASASEPPRTLAFRGMVRFSGHYGFLDVRISNPLIQITGNRAILEVDSSVETGGSVGLVEFSVAPRPAPSGYLGYEGTSVQLLPSAVSVFGDVYSAGESFDDIGILVSTASHD